MREKRQRRRNERQKPKPGKLQRFFHGVFSVITFECCRRKAIPKMTASGMFFLMRTSFQSTRSVVYNGVGRGDEFPNVDFSVALEIGVNLI